MKHERLLAYTTLALLGLAVLGGTAFFVQSINSLKVQPAKLLNAKGADVRDVRHGDELALERNYCLRREADVEFNPVLVDLNTSITYPLASGVMHLQQGCGIIRYAISVDDIPEGVYRFGDTLRYSNDAFGNTGDVFAAGFEVQVSE